ncbi:MAG TPA: folylpolyglutamate synthase/dihydrofolate synthase family protein [Alloiococcus sp.]|nr:folylpolyglutamate synthase/dihydrofolate synthase family protein [Alloiococcus sp.]
MKWTEVIQLINTTRGKGDKKDLSRMNRLLAELDNPQKELNVIHVAGTNGKGTTCAYISQTLKNAGFKTGLYTSPHLETIHERISINGINISTEDLILLTEEVSPIVANLEEEMNQRYYSFEILTAIAFLYFKKQKVDLLVLETGVGGKIDATNVVEKPIVSVITSIGLDHTHVLGETLEEITRHKAGIIKKERPVVVGPLNSSLIEIVEDMSNEMDSKLTVVDKENINLIDFSLEQQTFKYKNDIEITTKLIGNHQLANTAVAYEVLKVVQKNYPKLTDLLILEGLSKTVWPGRMQKLYSKPVVILDGAHNEIGVKALRQSIDLYFPNQKFTFFAGMMVEKDYQKMFNLMGDVSNKFYLISPDLTRGFNVEEVVKTLNDRGYDADSVESLEEILHYIENKAAEDEIIIIFGSLYLVGDLLNLYHSK